MVDYLNILLAIFSIITYKFLLYPFAFVIYGDLYARQIRIFYCKPVFCCIDLRIELQRRSRRINNRRRSMNCAPPPPLLTPHSSLLTNSHKLPRKNNPPNFPNKKALHKGVLFCELIP